MQGRVVSGGREAVIAVALLGDVANGAFEVEAVIDTGFTGHLTLPPEIIRSLDLPKRGFVEAELADGGVANLEVFDGRLLWHGVPRRVPVYGADTPLVGMSLLRGSRLTVEVAPGGEVAIEERV